MSRTLAGMAAAIVATPLLAHEPATPPAAEPAPIISREQAAGDWFGLRPRLEERGISFELQFFADYSRNFRGGLNRGDAFRHLFSLALGLETEPLLGWEGGRFFMAFQTFNGHNGTERLVGDLQGFSNIDADDFTQISELWYEQRLLGEALRIKVGKVEANAEFAYVNYGGEFIHSSPGFSPTILGFPSYPDPATSVNVFIHPTEWFYAGVGVYDGATQHGGYGRTGSRGPSTFFGSPSDLFLIGEAGLEWGEAGGRPGRLGVGVWRHTGDFEQFAGGVDRGTTGFYAVFDQLIWRENDNGDDQGIGLFAQYGWADPEVSEIEHHIGLGFAWAGAIPGRDADVWGLMGSYAGLSDEAGFRHSYELAIELFYKVQFTPWLSLKPDLQYIIHPGGEQDNAVVGTLRLEVSF